MALAPSPEQPQPAPSRRNSPTCALSPEQPQPAGRLGRAVFPPFARTGRTSPRRGASAAAWSPSARGCRAVPAQHLRLSDQLPAGGRFLPL